MIFYRFTAVVRSFHPCGTIIPPLWYDRSTYVIRSFHPGETIKIMSFNEFG